jgi:hypothetical protein
MRCVACCAADAITEGLWIGEADVLAGKDHDAARDEHRILAGVDHSHEPVESGIGIGAANALDERADRVVMLVASPVVEEAPALQSLADLRQSHRPPTIGTSRGRVSRELQRIERDASVAIRDGDERVLRVVRERDPAGEAALVGHCASHDRAHLIFGERLQCVDARARQQRGVHFEGRVLGRGAQQDHVAVLDVRQHDVLLRLVEAMDLVDEQHAALAGELIQLARFVDELAKLSDPARHRGDRNESRLRFLRRDRRERCLAGARWAPQDHRRQLARVDRLAKYAAFTDKVRLADELSEVAWAHARREWLGGGHQPILTPGRPPPGATMRQ